MRRARGWRFPACSVCAGCRLQLGVALLRRVAWQRRRRRRHGGGDAGRSGPTRDLARDLARDLGELARDLARDLARELALELARRVHELGERAARVAGGDVCAVLRHHLATELGGRGLVEANHARREGGLVLVGVDGAREQTLRSGAAQLGADLTRRAALGQHELILVGARA
eukprot:scaffold74172_cov68-Phaeocystis_antarctica.AAC.2